MFTRELSHTHTRCFHPGDTVLLRMDVRVGDYLVGQLLQGVVTDCVTPEVLMGVAFGQRVRIGYVVTLDTERARVDTPYGSEEFSLSEAGLLKLKPLP